MGLIRLFGRGVVGAYNLATTKSREEKEALVRAREREEKIKDLMTNPEIVIALLQLKGVQLNGETLRDTGKIQADSLERMLRDTLASNNQLAESLMNLDIEK